MKINSSKIPPEVKEYIRQAVAEGIQAGKALKRMERTAFQRTEARLFALPALRRKVEADKKELSYLASGGKLQERSKDLVRFSRGGIRVSPEEQLEAVINNLQATIAADEHEIATMDRALEEIAGEPYYFTVEGKYFERISDEAVAAAVPCDPSTVRRQRSRLVSQLSVLLYGAEALA